MKGSNTPPHTHVDKHARSNEPAGAQLWRRRTRIDTDAKQQLTFIGLQVYEVGAVRVCECVQWVADEEETVER